MILVCYEKKTKEENINSRALLLQSLGIYRDREGICCEGYGLKKSPKGKPYLEHSNEKEPISFSISHSGDLWVCAIQKSPLGIDIQFPRELKDKDSLARRFYTKEEYEYTVQHGLMGFYEIWVRKEAYIKYTGNGISEGLNSFSTIAKGELVPNIGNAFFDFRTIKGDYYFASCQKVEIKKGEKSKPELVIIDI